MAPTPPPTRREPGHTGDDSQHETGDPARPSSQRVGGRAPLRPEHRHYTFSMRKRPHRKPQKKNQKTDQKHPNPEKKQPLGRRKHPETECSAGLPDQKRTGKHKKNSGRTGLDEDLVDDVELDRKSVSNDH